MKSLARVSRMTQREGVPTKRVSTDRTVQHAEDARQAGIADLPYQLQVVERQIQNLQQGVEPAYMSPDATQPGIRTGNAAALRALEARRSYLQQMIHQFRNTRGVPIQALPVQ